MSDGLRPVPTLPELHKRGLAKVVERSPKTDEPTHYRATAQGQAEIDEAMLHNGRWLREHPAESAARFRQTLEHLRTTAPTKKKK